MAPFGQFLIRKAKGAVWRTRKYMEGDPSAFLRSCRSVVHVGANTGQERDLYARDNLDVLWIEPIPAVYAQLVHNIREYPHQRALQALITNRAGDMRTLNIASNNGASSSILDFALHKDIWPEIGYVSQMEIETTTLDDLKRGGALGPVDAVIMDAQGSEHLVIEGASDVLASARYVKAECADFESYVGCATLEALSEMLNARGFQSVRKDAFAHRSAGGTYYDVLFRKT